MNKHEVIHFDGKIYVPNNDSTESYYLINAIMSETQTCCRQRREYEFSQTIGYYRYTELDKFTIDSKKLLTFSRRTDIMNPNQTKQSYQS
ncbi:UNVERIFIED_ORG: hypothetical protein [Escherichia phage CMSTMSU]